MGTENKGKDSDCRKHGQKRPRKVTEKSPRKTYDDDDIVKRFGGENNLHYIIMTYCDKILEDKDLEPFFGNFEVESLIHLQKDFLLAAFAGPNSKYQYLHRQVALHHRHLLENGMNEIQFDILQNHFMNALRENWVEDDIVAVCNSNFAGLRYIFTDAGIPGACDEIDLDITSSASVSVLSSEEESNSEEEEYEKKLTQQETKTIIAKLVFWKRSKKYDDSKEKNIRRSIIPSPFKNHSQASSEVLRRNSKRH